MAEPSHYAIYQTSSPEGYGDFDVKHVQESKQDGAVSFYALAHERDPIACNKLWQDFAKDEHRKTGVLEHFKVNTKTTRGLNDDDYDTLLRIDRAVHNRLSQHDEKDKQFAVRYKDLAKSLPIKDGGVWLLIRSIEDRLADDILANMWQDSVIYGLIGGSEAATLLKAGTILLRFSITENLQLCCTLRDATGRVAHNLFPKGLTENTSAKWKDYHLVTRESNVRMHFGMVAPTYAAPQKKQARMNEYQKWHDNHYGNISARDFVDDGKPSTTSATAFNSSVEASYPSTPHKAAPALARQPSAPGSGGTASPAFVRQPSAGPAAASPLKAPASTSPSSLPRTFSAGAYAMHTGGTGGSSGSAPAAALQERAKEILRQASVDVPAASAPLSAVPVALARAPSNYDAPHDEFPREQQQQQQAPAERKAVSSVSSPAGAVPVSLSRTPSMKQQGSASMASGSQSKTLVDDDVGAFHQHPPPPQRPPSFARIGSVSVYGVVDDDDDNDAPAAGHGGSGGPVLGAFGRPLGMGLGPSSAAGSAAGSVSGVAAAAAGLQVSGPASGHTQAMLHPYHQQQLPRELSGGSAGASSGSTGASVSLPASTLTRSPSAGAAAAPAAASAGPVVTEFAGDLTLQPEVVAAVSAAHISRPRGDWGGHGHGHHQGPGLSRQSSLDGAGPPAAMLTRQGSLQFSPSSHHGHHHHSSSGGSGQWGAGAGASTLIGAYGAMSIDDLPDAAPLPASAGGASASPSHQHAGGGSQQQQQLPLQRVPSVAAPGVGLTVSGDEPA